MSGFLYAPPITPRQNWFNRLIWGVILAVAAVDIVWIVALRWEIDWHNIGILLAYLAIPLSGTVVFTRFYPEPRFALMTQILAQLMLLIFTLAAFNYVTSTLNLPMQDETLIRIDHAIGFDWYSYVVWVRRHPWLARLFTIGYNSAWLQLMAGYVLLFLTGNFRRLQQLVFAIIVSAIVAIILAAIWPAVAGYIHYNIDPATLPGTTMPAAGRAHAADLYALRSGAFHRVDLHFKGLITFPSYHTSFGILLIYAFWPFRLLRWPAVILNALLVASVPVDGGHYLVDALGGLAVAAAVIWLAEKLLPFTPAQPIEDVGQAGYNHTT